MNVQLTRYRRALLVGAALAAGLLAFPANAEVYRWVDEDGNVHYGDKPGRGTNAKPAELPELQSFKSAPPSRGGQDVSGQKGTSPAQGANALENPSIRIASPAAGETVRKAGNVLDVSVELSQPLAAGQGVVFYIDGQARNDVPVPATSMMIPRVYRGEHRVSAAVVDRAGRVAYQSPAITVYMKPPTVK